jgi:CSLREA domain-containing protein
LATGSLWAVLAGTAASATIQVNSTSDTPAPSTCTLREAIASADGNADSGNCTHTGTYGDDTITFASSTLGNSILLTSGELDINPTITGTLTIQGPGAVVLTVDAQQASRVFHVESSASPATNAVTIHGLEITNGKVTGTATGTVTRTGGGILNDGSLTLDRDYVRSNTVSATSTGGTFPIADALGGGIENTGTLTVSFTLVASNIISAQASNGAGSTTAAAVGAGIASFDAHALSIDHSSIYFNSATTNVPSGAAPASNPTGGGIASSFTPGFALANSTIDENTVTASGLGAQPSGGGIAAGEAALTDDTITGNSAASGGANLAQFSGTVTVKNTILAQAGGGAANCSGTITSPMAQPTAAR